jgi:hypothetical protein
MLSDEPIEDDGRPEGNEKQKKNIVGKKKAVERVSNRLSAGGASP